VADWGACMSASCIVACGSSCSLIHAVDGRIMHCSIVSSCHLNLTSVIVCHELCEQHCSK